jgi:hypothetical protein
MLNADPGQMSFSLSGEKRARKPRPFRNKNNPTYKVGLFLFMVLSQGLEQAASDS